MKYKVLIKNCTWLYIIQIANYLFPILTIPYLMRVIGVNNYGLMAVGQAVMAYINIIVDYGFNLTATRKIANYGKNNSAIKEEYNNVLVCKIMIMMICAFILLLVLYIAPLSLELKYFYLAAFTIVIGNTLFPIWFFQGIEDMKYITIINLISRSIGLMLLFLCVNEQSDYGLAIFLQGFSSICSSIIALIIIYKKYNICLYRIPSVVQMKNILFEGRAIFIANACGNIYGQGAVLIVAFFAGQAATAYFSLGQKISGTIVSMIQPFVQAIYPHVCKMHEDNRSLFLELFQSILKKSIGLNVVLAFSMFFMARYISIVIQGEVNLDLIRIIQIFSIVTFGTVLNVILHPFILAIGIYSWVQSLYMKISGIFIMISIPLTYYCGLYGMIFSLIVVEYFIGYHYLKILMTHNNSCG